MDNLAFEVHEDAKRKVVSEGKMNTSRMEKTRQWSLMNVFLVCLLACTVTTVIGVLIVSLVHVSNPQAHSEPGAQSLKTAIPVVPKAVDPKFQFLNHLSKSKVFEFPGGAIQWARYRSNASDYLGIEEEAFGSSLNSQRSQMSLGTLRIKSSGLRAPHWPFNANEHGYLYRGRHGLGDGAVVTMYSVAAGHVIFFPEHTVPWRKNMWPEGGINFIGTFHKQKEGQGINLPPNLAELVVNANYSQSPENFVWRYFYDLKGVGIINAQSSTEFNVHLGDVIFFPTGTQRYIKSTCDEDLLLLLAFSTGDLLQTLDVDDYLQATADHILAQLFFKKQSEFKKIPQFKEDQAVNLP